MGVTTPCSNLHDLDQISRGGPFLLKKWGLGDHFSTENFGLGDQNFQDQNSGDSTVQGGVLAPRYIKDIFELKPTPTLLCRAQVKRLLSKSACLRNVSTQERTSSVFETTNSLVSVGILHSSAPHSWTDLRKIPFICSQK